MTKTSVLSDKNVPLKVKVSQDRTHCATKDLNLYELDRDDDIEHYRHSSIYAVNVRTHTKNHESKNRLNRGYLVVDTTGEKNRIELKVAFFRKFDSFCRSPNLQKNIPNFYPELEI